MAEWIQKHDPLMCCLQDSHYKSKDLCRLNTNEWKKILHANRNEKKPGIAILISHKIDLKTKHVKNNKEAHLSHKGGNP